MIPIFLNYGALWALAGLILYAGIYLFRRRSKTVFVSSLMFYPNKKRPSEGGHKITKLQMPFILFLELLIATMFILAAAAPVIVSDDNRVGLSIILDDSVSMRVKNGEDNKTAQERALDYLNKNIFSKSYYSINLIKAGDSIDLIGNNDMIPNEAKNFLNEWKCNSYSSDLTAAIAFAGEFGDKDSLKIIITDSMKGSEIEKQKSINASNLYRLAFGKPSSNVAITSANRYRSGIIDRCFFEFTNYSNESVNLNAIIESESESQIYETINCNLSPKESRRSIINIQDLNLGIKAKVIANDFEEDNVVILNSVEKPRIKTLVSFQDKTWEKVINYTIKSLDNAKFVNADPDIIIGDTYSEDFKGWQIITQVPKVSSLLQGDIYIDNQHPMCEGMMPVKVAWAVDGENSLPGQAIMVSGKIPLVSIEEKGEKSKIIRFNMDYRYSEFYTTSSWPVLFWNIMNCYQNELYPKKNEQKLLRQESDFTDMSEYIEDIKTSSVPNKYFINVRWWFLLSALVLLVIHQILISMWRQGIVY